MNNKLLQLKCMTLINNKRKCAWPRAIILVVAASDPIEYHHSHDHRHGGQTLTRVISHHKIFI